MAATPSHPLKGFKLNNEASPTMAAKVLQTKAWFTVMRPEGRGRFWVRAMTASARRSMTWLNPFEAPVNA